MASSPGGSSARALRLLSDHVVRVKLSFEEREFAAQIRVRSASQRASTLREYNSSVSSDVRQMQLELAQLRRITTLKWRIESRNESQSLVSALRSDKRELQRLVLEYSRRHGSLEEEETTTASAEPAEGGAGAPSLSDWAQDRLVFECNQLRERLLTAREALRRAEEALKTRLSESNGALESQVASMERKLVLEQRLQAESARLLSEARLLSAPLLPGMSNPFDGLDAAAEPYLRASAAAPPPSSSAARPRGALSV